MPSVNETSVTEIKDVEAARKALTFFKVMALTVGVGLLILVAEMILKYGFSKDWLDWWPQPHGFIYIVYVVVAFVLAQRARWSLGYLGLMLLAGLVPVLIFWVEHRVVQKLKAENPDLEPVA